MILLKDHVYKIWNGRYKVKYPRQYIICCPSECVSIETHKEVPHIKCHFIVCFNGNIKTNSNCDSDVVTSWHELSTLESLTNADWDDVNKACKIGGFRYNRKLGKIC